MKNLPFWVWLLTAQAALGQIEIRGRTLDSIGDPLAYVNIVNQRTRTGTSSDMLGRFRLLCSPGDTLLFSRIGYREYRFPAEEDERNLIIILYEQPRLLSPVIITGTFKPFGHGSWTKTVAPSRFQNPLPAPGERLLPTFGPGILLGGLMTRSKAEKERRKAQKLEQTNRQTQAFRQFIQSEETRKYIIALFEISEETYYRKIEQFNKAYPDAYQLDTEKEMMDLLVAFFASRND